MGIELPGADALKSFQTGCQLDEVISELGDATCVAFSTSGYLGLPLGGPEQREEMLRTVMKYLWRSLKIRKVVDIMTEDICHGEQYLAFHWRNKSSEMPCFFGRDKSKDRCESIVREVRKLAHRASDAVSELMEQEHIKCIYVACPLWSLEIVDILARRIPRNRIIVSKDLPIPESDKAFVEDYYIMSLVEQEVAYRAAIFVAAVIPTGQTS
ncbi:uncharacterized protein [Ptychodera flava]|uniref:uncharacterized protein n=1 Tax=Ptychodera flava TaxID=63121 RepID=UPI003969BFA6